MLTTSPILVSRAQSARALKPALAVISMMAVACAACSAPSHAPASQARGGQLVWGDPAEADTLDPTIAGNAVNWELLNLAYERLVTLDSRLNVVPQLAESWKQTSPKTYEFTLRKGARFSNGRALTADDVVGTLKRLMDPKVAPWSAQLGMRSIVSHGPGRVTITLTSPRTSFLAALAASYAAILPMKEVTAGTFDPKKEMLGTGPFKVAAHSPGESWTFTRNPYYWRPGLPKVDRVIVRIMPDDAARTAALRNGTIDITTFGNPDSLRLLKGQANVATAVQQTTDYYRIDVNARSSLFADDRLRQALALAIDRKKISNVALGAVGRPTAAASVAFGGACDPNQVAFSSPDLQRARGLVAAAGATGKTVEIIAPSLVAMAAPIAQVIQQNLEAAGLKVRIATLDVGDVMKRVYSGKEADFDLVISWFAGFGDPSMVFNYWNPTVGGFGKLWVKPDADLVKLINKSSSTAPGPERTELLRATCDGIARQANIIPLVSKDAIVAYRPDKVSAKILPVEGYAVPLRNIAEFARESR